VRDGADRGSSDLCEWVWSRVRVGLIYACNGCRPCAFLEEFEVAVEGCPKGLACCEASFFMNPPVAVLFGWRRSLTQSEEARRLTAYHESGHALVALYTDGAQPIHKVSRQ